MEQKNIKRIVLKPIKVIRQSANNPYMRGLVTKRDLTTREACHIYREIYLFNLDLSLDDFDSREEKEYFYKDITEKMNLYIKGDVSWNDLCEFFLIYNVINEKKDMASLKLKIKKVVFKRKAASKREGCQNRF